MAVEGREQAARLWGVEFGLRLQLLGEIQGEINFLKWRRGGFVPREKTKIIFAKNSRVGFDKTNLEKRIGKKFSPAAKNVVVSSDI
jgi:hypothetical protein